MAIKNPNLQTQDIRPPRPQDLPDDRRFWQQVGQTVQSGVELFGEAQVAKASRDVDQARLDFLEENKSEVLDPETPDPESSDVFSDTSNDPDSKAVGELVDSFAKLRKAGKAGRIGVTELQIRQEKILREHINRYPWLADDMIKAASRVQGYNPMGSEIEALAAAQTAEETARNKAWEKMVAKFIDLGVNPAYQFTNPELFYATGFRMAEDAQGLAFLKTATDEMNQRGELTKEQATQFFVNNFEPKFGKGLMAALPGQVAGLLADYENLPIDIQNTSPEAYAQLQGRKQAVLNEWMAGGPRYLEMQREMGGMFKHLKQSDFDTMWKNYVTPYMERLGTARTAAEMRDATNFYANADWRQLLLDNPELNRVLHLSEVVGKLGNSPAAQLLGRQLANNLTGRLARLWGQDGSVPTEVAPVVDNQIGSEADRAGKTKEADVSREIAGKTSLDWYKGAVDERYTPEQRLLNFSKGNNTLVSALASVQNSTNTYGNEPSGKTRRSLLSVVASPEYARSSQEAAGLVQTEPQARAVAAAQQVVFQGTTFLVEDLGRHTYQRLIEIMPQTPKVAHAVTFELKNGVITAVPVAGEVDETTRRFRTQLINTINTQYGPELNEAYKALKNVLDGGVGGPAKGDEEAASSFIILLEGSMFGRGAPE